MLGQSSAIAELSQCAGQMLSDLLQKTADFNTPTTSNNFFQFRLGQIKHQPNRVHLKRLFETYQMIISNISSFHWGRQAKKWQEQGLINMLGKKDRAALFNSLNKNLKMSEDLAKAISEQICSGNQSTDTIKQIVFQTLKMQNVNNSQNNIKNLKVYINSAIKNMAALKQTTVKQQKIHNFFSNLCTSRFEQATKIISLQMSERSRLPAIKLIEELKSTSNQIDKLYFYLNQACEKYRSDIPIRIYKDHSKALEEIYQEIQRRNTKLYEFIQEIQKLNLGGANKQKGMPTGKMSARLQNLLNNLKNAKEQLQKLGAVKNSYEAVVAIFKQSKQQKSLFKSNSIRRSLTDIKSEYLQDKLKQFQQIAQQRNDQLKKLEGRLKEAIAARDQAINKMNSNFKSSRKQLTGFEQAQLRNKIGQLNQKLLQKEITQFNQRKQQMELEIATARSSKTANDLTIAQLFARIKELVNQSNRLIFHKEQLRSKVNQLQNLLGINQAQLAKTEEVQASKALTLQNKGSQQIELKNKLTALSNKISQLQKSQSNLREQIATLSTANQELQATLELQRQKSSQLSKVNQGQIHKLKQKDLEIKYIQQKTSQLLDQRQLISQFQQNITRLDQNIGKLSKVNEELVLRLELKEQELKEMLQSNNRLIASSQYDDEVIHILGSKIKQQHEKDEMFITALKMQLREKNQIIIIKNKQIQQKQAQLNTSKQQSQEKLTVFNIMQKQIQKLNLQNAQTSERNQINKETIAKIQKKVIQVLEEKKKLNDIYLQALQRCEEKQRLINALIEGQKELKDQALQRCEQKQRMINSLIEGQKELKDINEALKIELGTTKEQFSQNSTKVNELTHALLQKQSELKTLRKQNQEKSLPLIKKQKQVQRLNFQKEQLFELYKKNKQMLAKLQKELQDALKEKESLNQLYVNSQSECKQKQNQLTSLRKQFEQRSENEKRVIRQLGQKCHSLIKGIFQRELNRDNKHIAPAEYFDQ